MVITLSVWRTIDTVRRHPLISLQLMKSLRTVFVQRGPIPRVLVVIGLVVLAACGDVEVTSESSDDIVATTTVEIVAPAEPTPTTTVETTTTMHNGEVETTAARFAQTARGKEPGLHFALVCATVQQQGGCHLQEHENRNMPYAEEDRRPKRDLEF